MEATDHLLHLTISLLQITCQSANTAITSALRRRRPARTPKFNGKTRPPAGLRALTRLTSQQHQAMVFQGLERIHDQTTSAVASRTREPPVLADGWSAAARPDRQKYFCRFSCLVLA